MTQVAVVGGGPVGIYCAIALARAGHSVTLVDRDPGPPQQGEWRRRGVMQFRHPHYFRSTVRQALQEVMPDVWGAVVQAGGVPALPEGLPPEMTALQCRRSTFERVLWERAREEPGLRIVSGLAEHFSSRGDRVSGVVVAGEAIPASVVICASGRGGALGDELRAPGVVLDCGFSYVSRMYRSREPGGVPASFPAGAVYNGFQAIAFPQDADTLSALIVRASDDEALVALRRTESFDAVVPMIPHLAVGTDPSRFEPLTEVLVGGRLINSYRSLLDDNGRAPLAGVLFVGDAVSTTNPAAGRGTALGLQQAQELLRLLAEAPDEPREVAEAFDRWCTSMIRPWFEDHVQCDAARLAQWAGHDLDVEGPISSDVVVAASAEDPSMTTVTGPYFAMQALPSSLEQLHDQVRERLRSGWRPSYAAGPSRDDLLAAIGQQGR